MYFFQELNYFHIIWIKNKTFVTYTFWYKFEAITSQKFTSISHTFVQMEMTAFDPASLIYSCSSSTSKHWSGGWALGGDTFEIKMQSVLKFRLYSSCSGMFLKRPIAYSLRKSVERHIFTNVFFSACLFRISISIELLGEGAMNFSNFDSISIFRN